MKLSMNPVVAWTSFVATLVGIGLAVMFLLLPPKQTENWIWSDRWPGGDVCTEGSCPPNSKPRLIHTPAHEAESMKTPHSGKSLPD